MGVAPLINLNINSGIPFFYGGNFPKYSCHMGSLLVGSLKDRLL